MYSVIQQILCIYNSSSIFTSHSLSFCQTRILSLFLSGFVEICCSAFPFFCPSPFFKRDSHISSLLFIVCFAIPLYQPQSWAAEVTLFCVGGSEVQQYVRPRAAYLRNAIRLESSKSHWNHNIFKLSEKTTCRMNRGWKIQHRNPHTGGCIGQTPFIPPCFQCDSVQAFRSDSPRCLWMWSGSGHHGATAGLRCSCCAVELTQNECNYFHYHRYTTQSNRNEKRQNWGDLKCYIWNPPLNRADWQVYWEGVSHREM